MSSRVLSDDVYRVRKRESMKLPRDLKWHDCVCWYKLRVHQKQVPSHQKKKSWLVDVSVCWKYIHEVSSYQITYTSRAVIDLPGRYHHCHCYVQLICNPCGIAVRATQSEYTMLPLLYLLLSFLFYLERVCFNQFLCKRICDAANWIIG